MASASATSASASSPDMNPSSAKSRGRSASVVSVMLPRWGKYRTNPTCSVAKTKRMSRRTPYARATPGGCTPKSALDRLSWLHLRTRRPAPSRTWHAAGSPQAARDTAASKAAMVPQWPPSSSTRTGSVDAPLA